MSAWQCSDRQANFRPPHRRQSRPTARRNSSRAIIRELMFELNISANHRSRGCTNSAVPLMPDQVSSPAVAVGTTSLESPRAASLSAAHPTLAPVSPAGAVRASGHCDRTNSRFAAASRTTVATSTVTNCARGSRKPTIGYVNGSVGNPNAGHLSGNRPSIRVFRSRHLYSAAVVEEVADGAGCGPARRGCGRPRGELRDLQ